MLFEEAHEVYPFVNAKCRYQGAASPYGMLVSFLAWVSDHWVQEKQLVIIALNSSGRMLTYTDIKNWLCIYSSNWHLFHFPNNLFMDVILNLRYGCYFKLKKTQVYETELIYVTSNSQ